MSIACRYLAWLCLLRQRLPLPAYIKLVLDQSFYLFQAHLRFSLQALESFLLRCPRDITTYCDEILQLTLDYVSYDPNFTDNMEEDTDDESHEEEEDECVLLYACKTVT